jgi:hypothetical protein
MEGTNAGIIKPDTTVWVPSKGDMVIIDGEGCDYSVWVETLYEAEGAVEPCDFVHRGRVRRGGAAWAVTVFQLSRDYVEIQYPNLDHLILCRFNSGVPLKLANCTTTQQRRRLVYRF